jgi:ankyrin repeat protein
MKDGDTALHDASRNGYEDICSLLLKKGADIAVKNLVSDAEIVDIYRTCMPSRALTYTSPPPGDLTLPYLKSNITFRTYCIYPLPHFPPLFLFPYSYGRHHRLL